MEGWRVVGYGVYVCDILVIHLALRYQNNGDVLCQSLFDARGIRKMN